MLELPDMTVIRLLFLPWLSCSGASGVCGRCARCPVLRLWMLGLSMTAAVGEELGKAGFEMNITRWGVVAVESTRPAV